MCPTLLVIPKQIAGIDVFGFGWLLGGWAMVSLALVGWSAYRHGWGGETRGQIGMALVVGLIIAFVLPNVMEDSLGGLPIRGYGVMLLVAVVAGVGLSLYRGHRVGLDPEMLYSLGTWLFISGIIGARLFYVVEYWERFQRPTLRETIIAMLNLTQGGLVVFGALLAGGTAFIVFIHRHRLPGLALADLIAPGVVLGMGVGRLGCFLYGCCYGGPTDLPWAVQFPRESSAYMAQVERGTLYVHGLMFAGSGQDPAVIESVEPDSPAEQQGLAAGQRVVAIGGERVASVAEAQWQLMQTYGEGTTVAVAVEGDPVPKRWKIAGPPPRTRPLHPTQLYSFVDGVLLCLLLLAYEPFKRRDGELIALLLVLHPLARFLIEFIRIDESAVFGTGLSISQNISIAIFVAGVALWIYLLWRRPPGIAWRPGRGSGGVTIAPATTNTI